MTQWPYPGAPSYYNTNTPPFNTTPTPPPTLDWMQQVKGLIAEDRRGFEDRIQNQLTRSISDVFDRRPHETTSPVQQATRKNSTSRREQLDQQIQTLNELGQRQQTNGNEHARVPIDYSGLRPSLKYAGKPNQDLTNWIAVHVRFFKTAKVPTPQQATYLLTNCEGAAASLLDQLTPSEQDDPTAILNKLKSTYMSEVNLERARNHFEGRLQKKNEDVEEYYNELQKIR